MAKGLSIAGEQYDKSPLRFRAVPVYRIGCIEILPVDNVRHTTGEKGALLEQSVSLKPYHLHFERGYKRLEKGRLKMPKIGESMSSIELDSGELSMLLEGLDLNKVKRPKRWEPPRNSSFSVEATL